MVDPGAHGLGDLDRHAARDAATALVILQDGTVAWLNTAARAIVEPFGGSWAAPGSPVTVLAALPPGARRMPTRWPSAEGGTRWWQVSATLVPGGVLYEIVDETDRVEEDGRDTGPPTAQWRLARLEAMTGQGSWVFDVADNTLEFSEALAARFGVVPAFRYDADGFRNRYHPADAEATLAAFRHAIRTGEPFHYVARMYTDPEQRDERVFEGHAEVFRDATGRSTRVMGTLRDITEAHRDRAQLTFLADHDPLTGVANRRQVNARLVEFAVENRAAALLMIDIDNFKDINDLRGHPTGDRVIQHVASTIGTTLGSGAVLGRLGGDEFAVLVPGCTRDAAMVLAERLRAAVACTAALDAAMSVTISIGVAAVEPGQDPAVGLARADLALYAAKAAGRNRVRLFTPEHYRSVARRVSVVRRVASALEHGLLDIDAQPIVDLGTGRVTRHEVLVRLRDGIEPALGPAEFLPAAERTDLVLEVDRWVLEQAVGALATPAARASGLRLEVNVSARSVDGTDLGSHVLNLLKTHDVEPHRLGLEMTETAAIRGLAAARALAVRLTEAGCGIALDDFGAGYGSFTYLKHLPFTVVKIAGEFVRRVDEDPVDEALVAGVVGVARRLGMRTVAEEVARPSLVEPLRALGVDDGQGFHLGRPRPLALLTRGPAHTS